MPEIHAINLTRDPRAIAFLTKPQPCTCCEGSGCHIIKQRTTLMGFIPVTSFSIERCDACLGSGYAVYFSWS